MTQPHRDSAQRPAVRNPLLVLHELGRSARKAHTLRELEFIAVNDTRKLSPYRQAAFWLRQGGVRTLSGVVKVDAHVPYVQWLNRLARWLDAQGGGARRVSAADVPDAIAADWSEWVPAHVVWVPLPHGVESSPGALLYARDLDWAEAHVLIVAEWVEIWGHCWISHRQGARFALLRALLGHRSGKSRPWWRSPRLVLPLLLLAVAAVPVQLTVLAPAELVPASPAVVRAPLDGVIDAVHVHPNDLVSEGQPLFSFDPSLLRARMETASQSLVTAETEYHQTMQQALSDQRRSIELNALAGRIEERRAELEFLRTQLARSQVLAPMAGVVLFDDPAELIGRPASIGERVMRIAMIEDVEVEAWLAVADAIPLEEGASVRLFLNASPGRPVEAALRYVGYEAVQRPDQTYAYRVRARLVGETTHRVGLKGTVKVYGERVPVAYWVLRRPIGGLRTTLGL
jgi:hypothetical protein